MANEGARRAVPAAEAERLLSVPKAGPCCSSPGEKGREAVAQSRDRRSGARDLEIVPISSGRGHHFTCETARNNSRGRRQSEFPGYAARPGSFHFSPRSIRKIIRPGFT
jgi:hypothetical protein